MDIRIGTWLSCGCCGSGFKTWNGYKDQDQDADYGICRSCQADAIRANRKLEREGFAVLRDALNDINRAKFDACPLWKKRYLLHNAFESGHMTWKIERYRSLDLAAGGAS